MADVRRLVLLFGSIASFTGCNCADAELAPAELQGLLVLDPDHLDFGSIELGTEAELPLEILNSGQGDLMIRSAVGDGTPFSIRSANNTELIPSGERAPFAVTFSPVTAGDFEGTIAISHDGLNGPISTLHVKGSGKSPPPTIVSFDVFPASLDFGAMGVGETRTMSFIVENTGDLALDISDIALQNSDQYRLSFPMQLPASVAMGERVQVDVTYVGVSLGANTGRVVVTTNAPEAMKGVDLHGEAYGPDIDVTPSPLEFGVVGINSLAPSKQLTIRNAGSRALNVQAIDFRASSAELTLLDAPATPFTLIPGATQTIEVQYDPADGVRDEGTLVITSDDPDEHTFTVLISGTGGDPTGCSLAVLNAPVDFGYVMRGGRSTLPLTLINVGLQPCPLTAAQVIGAGGPFAVNVDRPGAPATIPPQTVQHLLVDFAPRAYGDASASVLLEAGAPVDARFRVPLTGKSAASEIAVLPSIQDFGDVAFGCSTDWTRILIYNRGDHDEHFLGLHPAPGTSLDFEIATNDLGDDIEDDNDDYLEVFVRYRPTAIGFAAGALVIEHSGPASPVVVPLFAEGSAGANVVDSFRQSKPGKVDVLFVLDGSDDMDLEREQMLLNASSFMSAADASAADYQIGVTSMDTSSGGERGRIYAAPLSIITPRSADRSAALSALFGADLGDDGDERGLEAAYLGLGDPTLNDTNAGFHRDGAALSVIYVSNEDDHSDWPFLFYRDALTSLKGLDRRDATSVSAFIGTRDSFCSTNEGGAEFGDDYLWLVGAVGGRIESMCTANYSASLTALADESFGVRRTFHLSSAPSAGATGAIGVNVNGVAQLGDSWQYLPDANAIRFSDSATPPDGATVELSYTSACY